MIIRKINRSCLFLLIAPFMCLNGMLLGQVTHNGSISGNPAWTYNNVSQAGGTSIPYIALADITSTSSAGQSGVNTSSGSVTSPNMTITGSSVINFQGRTYNGYCDPSTSNDILVEYSEDGGGSFTFLAIFEPLTNVLTDYNVALPASTVGQDDVQVRFSSVAPSSSTNGSSCVACAATTGPCLVKTAGIDNISITNALPVSLTYFVGSIHTASILLSFSTATERNNSHFEIERSADGRVFATIGRVAGAGTSTRAHEYAFEDKAPRKGVNYYRLRQVDFDGSAHLSQVIAVQNGRTTGMYVVTAPGHSETRVRLEENSAEEGCWQVMDGSGRVLSTGTLPAESRDFSFETAGWIPGIYIVRLQCGSTALVQRFLH